MLRADELMVGDWVYCEGQPTPENVTIQTIAEDGVWFNGPNYEGSASYDRIFPICLTPAILEKNGFKSNDNMFGFQDYELSKDFLLENRGERYCLVKRFLGHRHSTFFIIEVCFIHELQHCMKLCGIDKTIEL